jgi:hypothetical protein
MILPLSVNWLEGSIVDLLDNIGFYKWIAQKTRATKAFLIDERMSGKKVNLNKEWE